MNKLEEFIDKNTWRMILGYIEALYFTDEGINGISKNSNLSEELFIEIKYDCQSFLLECWKYSLINKESFDAKLLGQNFWLNRNHHGTGFWDNENIYGIFSNKLSMLSHSYGDMEVYLGDDGLIYSI